MDISSELKLTEIRKKSLLKTFEEIESQSSSILFLALQWKDMESHIDSVQSSIAQRQEQLVSLEDSLRKRLEEAKLREERVKSVEESFSCRLKEIELNEANEKLLFEERAKELDLMRVSLEERSREFEISRVFVEEKINELNLKEKRFRMLRKFGDLRTEELEHLRKSVGESLGDIEFREKHLSFVENWAEERIKDIELREARIEESSNAIVLEKKQFEQTVKEVKLKETSLQEREKMLKLKKKRLDEREITFKLEESRLEEHSLEIVLKDRNLKEHAEELELKEHKFEECKKTFSLKEESLKERDVEIALKEDSLKERTMEIALKEDSLKEHALEIALKESNLKDRTMEIALKEDSLKERAMEIALKEDGLKERAMEIALKEDSLKERALEVALKEDGLNERVMEVALKECGLKERTMEIAMKEDGLKERSMEIALKEDGLNERSMKIASKEERLKEHAEKLELKENLFEECTNRVQSMEKDLEGRLMEIDSKNKKLVERIRKVDLKDKELDQRIKDVDLKEDTLDKLIKNVEMKEKQNEQRSQANETKDKGSTEIVIYDCKAFEISDDKAIDGLGREIAQLSDIIDGKSLQMYLNEHCKEHDLIHDEVSAVLRASSDPAKLVLDAMNGFHPLRTEDGCSSAKLSIIRKSCILLLEGLLKLSPEINTDTKNAAIKVAFDWITKMRPEAENDMEVLGFLLLLAAYKMVSVFDASELLTYLLIVARYRQASQLCWILGLVDKISDIIHNLIKETKHLDAFRLVCAFKLVGKFQPVELLRTYLKKTKRDSMIKCKGGVNSRTEQINSMNKRIADVNTVIRCIEHQNLESGYSSRNLRNLVLELTQRKADMVRKKCELIAAEVPPLSNAPFSGAIPNIQKQGTAISASDGLITRFPVNSFNPSMKFPHQQGSKIGQGCGVISTQIEIKPKKMQNSSRNNNKEGCTASFEQLMMVPAQMRRHNKEAAMKVAVTLKANLNGEMVNKMDVFRFLQLVANYDLASSFAADELKCLFKYVYRRKLAPDLCRALGLANEIPSFVENLVQEDHLLEAIRYICAFQLKHKFPLVSLIKSYLNGVVERAQKRGHLHPDDQNFAINKEISASRNVLTHIKNHKLESEYPPKILEDRIKQLEIQKAAIVGAIKSICRYDPLQQKSENNYISSSKSPSSTTNAAAPSLDPGLQPQKKSGMKRPRTNESAETPSSDPISATFTGHSNQRPPKRKSKSDDRDWVLKSTGHDSLGRYKTNQNRGSYPDIDISYFPRDDVLIGHLNHPDAYCGIDQTGYVDHLMSYSGHSGGYGQPTYPNGQPTYPNGQPTYPNGQPTYHNGQATYHNGQAPPTAVYGLAQRHASFHS